MGWFANLKTAAAEQVAWEKAHPGFAAANRAGGMLGVTLTRDDKVRVKGQGEAPVAGLRATVESVGELRSRVTATRLLATGVFAFALKKKTDDRQVFLTIEGDETSFLIEVAGKPENQAAARRVATYINSRKET